jgi:peptidoglycan/LPS O-acetylase OafA/YrhL
MLGVFLHHLWKGIILTPDGAVQWSLDLVFSAGSDGVVFFNIISGFLLSLPYLGPQRRPFAGYGSFLSRRMLRILPPYFIGLLLFSLGNIVIFGIPILSALGALLVHLLFVNSLSYEMMASNFSPFWYLGMLVQFYLLFPLVLHFFLRAGPARATLFIIGICWGSWSLLALAVPPGPIPDMAQFLFHFNLPGRLPEFAIGMWLASAWNPKASLARKAIPDRAFLLFLLGLAFYALLGAPFVRTMVLPLLHGFHVALSVLFFMALFVWAPIGRMGGWGLVKRLSGLSYGLYIVHQPLFSYVGVIPGEVDGTLSAFFSYLIFVLPLACVVAMAINRAAARVVQTIAGGENYGRFAGLQVKGPGR